MILSGIHEDICPTAFLTEPYRINVLLSAVCFEVRHHGFEISHQVRKSGQGFSAFSSSCRYLCRLSWPGFRKALDIIDTTMVSLFFLNRRWFRYLIYIRVFLQSLNRCICRSIQCFRRLGNSVAQLHYFFDVIHKRSNLLQLLQTAGGFSEGLLRSSFRFMLSLP